MDVALKVDVDSLRGTLEGVPALLRLFDRHGVRATFLFSLGPDHTGRALRRVFRRGFLGKVRRTSVVTHYGLKTLLYGTLLPGPDIGRRAGDLMRSVSRAGHEVGIHCHDHAKWQDQVAVKDEAWTRREMERARHAFERVFGRPARVHGAAGWQLNAHTLLLEERMGLDYASDTRGSHPFYPELDGTRSSCPQIPTTLPTLDELLGRGGITERNAHERVYAETLRRPAPCQVYTLHAELEGMRLIPVMDGLLTLWRAAQARVCALEDLYRGLDPAGLPRHRLEWRPVPGRSGLLAVQGEPLTAGGAG